MLAGLLFAIHDAEDRPERLTATLPFGGTTLVEYQARQLIAAGASQIIVLTRRLTPELLGALSRIGRRAAVDTVRSAAEASEKLHPLARVVMLADGLVTTDLAVADVAHEGGDALVVVPDTNGTNGFERVGGGMCWAGIARLQPQRVAEVASLPRDYDVQSALIRVASQAGAGHLLLPEDALRHGHGIAESEAVLADRGRRVLASFFSGRHNWFDRFVVAPAARRLLPVLITRAVPKAAMLGVAGAAGAAGLILLASGYAASGLALSFLGTLTLTVAAAVGGIRGEAGQDRAARLGIALLPGLAVLALGWACREQTADGVPLVIALALVAIGALGERAMRVRESWWGSPPGYLLVVLAGALAGMPATGLAIAAVFATATLAAAIERLRAQP